MVQVNLTKLRENALGGIKCSSLHAKSGHRSEYEDIKVVTGQGNPWGPKQPLF